MPSLWKSRPQPARDRALSGPRSPLGVWELPPNLMAQPRARIRVHEIVHTLSRLAVDGVPAAGESRDR